MSSTGFASRHEREKRLFIVGTLKKEVHAAANAAARHGSAGTETFD
jgi:hypothetical protein